MDKMYHIGLSSDDIKGATLAITSGDPGRVEKIANYLDVQSGIITTEDSKIPVFVVPTNEELMIAEDTINLIKSLGIEKEFSINFK